MQEGKCILWIHIVHMSIVFLSVTVSVVLGPCFGFDKMDDFSVMFGKGEYTIFAYLYIVLIILFLMLVFFSSFSTIPYTIFYWIKRFLDSDGLPKASAYGVLLTLFSVLLMAIYPFGIMDMLGANEDVIDTSDWPFWLAACSVTVISTCFIPYMFIRLIYLRIIHLPMYRVYINTLKYQLTGYVILAAYWLTPLPDVLKQLVDNRFLYYWAR